MLSITAIVIFGAWCVAGAIVGIVFFRTNVLPVYHNRCKTVIGVLWCGPITWLIVSVFLIDRGLGRWVGEY